MPAFTKSMQTLMLLFTSVGSLCPQSVAGLPRDATRMEPSASLCIRILTQLLECRDSVNARALSGSAYTDGTAMTDEACTAFCTGGGYIYAGTEYSQECCKLYFCFAI